MAAALADSDPEPWKNWSPVYAHDPAPYPRAPPLFDFHDDIPHPSSPDPSSHDHSSSSNPSSSNPSSSHHSPSHPRPHNKLRKVTRTSPPPLPPLSFIPDDPHLLSSIPSLTSTNPTSPTRSPTLTVSSRAPLLPQNALLRKPPPPRPPPTAPATSTRKLTKRRPSLSSLTLRSYAYLPDQSPPPVPSIPSLPSASQTTHANSAPAHPEKPQRSASMRIIRGFSLRARKSRHDHHDPDSKLPSPSSPSGSSRWGRWPTRSSASESGHVTPDASAGSRETDWLPPIEMTVPFHINIPTHHNADHDALRRSSWQHDPSLTMTALTPVHSLVESPIQEYSNAVPISSRRAKFTFGEPEAPAPPPGPFFDLSTSPSDHTALGNIDAETVGKAARPPLVRRDAKVSTARRRWTLAMAITDEGITDEVLVEELERMRMRREWTLRAGASRRRRSVGEEDELDLDDIGREIWDAGGGKAQWGTTGEDPHYPEGEVGASERERQRTWDEDNWFGDDSEVGHDFNGQGRNGNRRSAWKENGAVYGGPKDDDDHKYYNNPYSGAGAVVGNGAPKISYTPSLPSFPSPTAIPAARSTTTPLASWHTARRALLTCRELVRTERHYLRALEALLIGETDAPAPALMLRYAEELVSVGRGLLGRMEEDPSAWGVASAFLAGEEGVEGAFVGWCGVVGGWFEGASEQPIAMRRGDGAAAKGGGTDAAASSGSVSPLMRTVSTWRKSMPSIANLSVSVNVTPASSPVSATTFLSLSRRREKEREKERERLQGHSNSSMTGTGLGTQTASAVAGGAPKRRKPSIRDLAILPTQRVMRYVLLYRDLLAHTPSTAPSRALVERAVEAASRIAQKCDRAQGNSAFLQRR